MNKLTKVKTIYSSLSAPVKASLWFTICSVVQRGIALLSTPIFTRIMTTQEYGVYTLYQAWYSIVLIFATLNLYAGVYNNGMTKWPEDRPRYTSALQGLSTTLTAVLFAVYLVAMRFWNDILGLSTILVFAMFLQVLFDPAYNFWSAGQRYDYKYKRLVAVTLLIGVSNPLLGVLAVTLSSHKAEARVLSYVFVSVCVGLAFYVYNAKRGKVFYDKEYWKFALSFNIPLIPHYLSQTVLNQADRIMIADMVGNGEAAIYGVAYSVSMMFTIVTGAINNTFIPYTYKALRDKTYPALKRSASFLVLMVGAACVVAMAFGPEIIRIFAAPEYYEARWIIPPVAASLFFMFIFPLFCNIEFYYEQTKFIMVASSIAAVLNVALNTVAIELFGYIAAAYTTLVCYIMLAVAHYAAHRVILRKREITFQLYDMRSILMLSVLILFVMVFMTLIYDYILIRYAVILAICLALFAKRKLILEKLQEIKNSK